MMIENELVDKISELPDDVLVAIISRLTWQEAIATSVLSTRWRNLYTYIVRLSYNTRHPSEQSNYTYVQQLEEKEFPKYIKEIYDFLNSNNGCGFLKEFRVHLPCLKGANIKTWFPLLLEREVESIDIRMIYHTKSMPAYYSVPSKSLIKEKGGGLGSFPGLKSLRILSLHSLHVEDRDVELFVSNCPVLEHLSIAGSYKLKKVSLVGHSKLKRLDICSSRKASSIEVRDMINLVSLTCHKLHPEYSLLLHNVPKLIEFNSDDQEHLVDHILPGISSFILDQLQQIEVHMTGKTLLFFSAPLLRNLKHLKLRLSNFDGGHRIPLYLLEAWDCPNLQKIELKLLRLDYQVFDYTYYRQSRMILEMGYSSPGKTKFNLKEVTILGFTGSIDELTFTCSLIIREGMGLEQLIVQPCEGTYEIRCKAAALARSHFPPIIPISAKLIII
ncbi:putative F-box/LRR-repeat protein At4g15060 [Primulina huaijiensis]|uniref:putative F-box/LRR-repeat protein At4g15060 n=1 Tax=Primulina huaijiensis TaxID=1492673 RepID=UPI003CC76813